jgi:autotransporter-associated beta strand protein
MTNASSNPTNPTWPLSFATPRSLALLAAALALSGRALAADVTWDGGAAGTNSAWRTAGNWNPDGVPAANDNAVFDSAGTVTICTIDMGAAAGTQQVGMVTLGSGRGANLSIRNLSSSTNDGILRLNGVNGLVLSNSSATASLTFSNASTGKLLGLGLATNALVYTLDNFGGTAGQISIYSVISEIGGSRSLTKIGSGVLYLRGVNTYSGDTIVNEGNLEVDDVGTIGNGVGTLYLSGGHLLAGATRNGTASDQLPVVNPIVVTTDAYIQNKSGTATTRYLALSGTLSGTGGTLKIANATSTPGNTFAVRFFNGSINYSRPMVVGDPGYDTGGAYSVMESANTNGTQIFSGDISGVGSIRRLNPYSAGSPAGTTVLSGNNTYSGGTQVSSGTMLANNTTGSALGSGPVTVTNLGVLAGSGAVIAQTSVSANGTLSPGAAAGTIGNLTVSDLTLGGGANYLWHVTSVSGTAGVSWDLITASGGWTDAASSGNAVTLKIDSLGAAPAGWNSAAPQDWVIIQSPSANGFDPSHFILDTSAFAGTVQGIFALSTTGGALHLTYTPAGDTVLNVPAGSVTQGQTSPTPYPLLTGNAGVVKIGAGEVIFTNSLNNYLGSTKVYAGTASITVDALNGSGALGAATTPVLLGNTTGNSNAAINIKLDGVTLGRSVVVQSGGTGSKTLGTSIGSGTALFTGDVTLQDSASLAAAAGGAASFSGNFTGAGGLTIGGGTITLSALNSYAGPTVLTGGTLNLNAKALGTNTFTIAGPSILDNTSPAAVTLNNCPQVWNADFTFGGTTNLNLGAGPVLLGGSRVLTVNASTLTVGGSISGAGGLVKLGAGTLALTATNSYTGGTTNSAGILSVNGTMTMGDGSGTLLLNGGRILNTGTRSGAPLANPVIMATDTTIYGNSTAAAPSTRILPFSGDWTVTGGTLRVGNTGLAGNTFDLRLTAGMDITFPVIVGDTNFDTPGAISELELYNSNTNPVQTVSGLISGVGSVRRGNLTAGAGGTTVMVGNNTFSGGFILDSGTLGIGLNSTPTSGALTSGPLGTGIFEIDNDPAIYIYASGGPRTLGNRIFLNGVTNTVFTGTNALTLTGSVDLGGVAKTLTVSNTAPVTFSGSITNTAAIIKAGPGQLIFSGDNSLRTNSTSVNAGALLVNNTAGSGNGTGPVVVNAGGTLGGTGTLGGAVTVNAGGILAPGASIGTLTVSSDLVIAGDLQFEVNTSASPSNDFVVVTGLLTNGGTGTLTVSNLGPALAVGNRFQLFSGPVLNGAALMVTGGGVTWTNLLAIDGSIQVAATGGGSAPSFVPASFAVQPNGAVSFSATGSIGSTYKLWASTNVAAAPVSGAWTLLQSGTVTTSPFAVQDPTATNYSRRFYIFSAP